MTKKRNYALLTSGKVDADIKENEDGSVEVKQERILAKMQNSGGIDLNYDGPINGVSIENIADLLTYDLSRDEAVISHHIQFLDGGSAHITYRPDGKDFKFTATRVGMSVNQRDGVIILRKYRKEPPPALMTMPTLGSG